MRFPFNSTLPIAHRGAHGPGYPENSILAIEKAIEIGAPAVEFDVCNLKDGTLVISHDPWAPINGKKVPLAQLSPADLGHELIPCNIPRVEPFLEVVAGSNLLLNFDWKGNGYEDQVSESLQHYGLLERTVVSAEDIDVMVRLKQADPHVTTGLSLETVEAQQIPALLQESQADAVMLQYSLASPEMVAAVRAENAGLFLWTVRDTATYEYLLQFKPDGIATDIITQQINYPLDK